FRAHPGPACARDATTPPRFLQGGRRHSLRHRGDRIDPGGTRHNDDDGIEVMLRNPMHRQVLLLATPQALFQSVGIVVVTVGGLAGAQVSSPALATVPMGAMFLGNALVTVPASLWMTRVGRRPGFLMGAVLGVLGGLVAAGGIVMSSLVV